jgi:hypothetical protein
MMAAVHVSFVTFKILNTSVAFVTCLEKTEQKEMLMSQLDNWYMDEKPCRHEF